MPSFSGGTEKAGIICSGEGADPGNRDRPYREAGDGWAVMDDGIRRGLPHQARAQADPTHDDGTFMKGAPGCRGKG